MGYLALAVLSSTCISVVMRAGESKLRSEMAMFLTNYIVCTGLAVLFMKGAPAPLGAPGILLSLGLGTISGILYLASFLLMKSCIRKNGIMITSTFMKLGVLVPTLMAVAVFHEKPGLLQLTGFALALGAVLLLQLDKNASRRQSGVGLLPPLLLLVSGISDSLANIYDKTGSAALKDWFLLSTFLAAAVLALLLLIRQRQKASAWDILYGILIGVPNYFSARFLLLALGRIPAMVVYPVCNVSVIVLVCFTGVFLFHESFTGKKKVGMGLILIALILLNLK